MREVTMVRAVENSSVSYPSKIADRWKQDLETEEIWADIESVE